jgi:hypothetical protein
MTNRVMAMMWMPVMLLLMMSVMRMTSTAAFGPLCRRCAGHNHDQRNRYKILKHSSPFD